MAWARLDDKFHENAKQLRASHAAVHIWVCSMSYCADASAPTGFMSFEQAAGLVRKLHATRAVIIELVRLGAWEEVAGGYLLHDFDEYVERGSRDRTREYRDRKRAERDALVTSPPRHAAVTARHGDVTVTSLARDGKPVPVPEPVEGSLEPSVGSLQPLEKQILQWWCDQHGWLAMHPEIEAKEETIAKAFAAMPLTPDLLFAVLNELWMKAKKKPMTLNYFSRALEEAVSESKNELAGSRGNGWEKAI